MRVFFDTNVFVYAFGGNDPRKQRTAHELIGRCLVDHEAVISTQVLVELTSALLNRGVPAIAPADVGGVIKRLSAFEVLETTTASILDAIELMRREQLAWWDALIVESALRGGCEVMYSEDLQHGRRYESMRVENPFRPAGELNEPKASYRASKRTPRRVRVGA